MLGETFEFIGPNFKLIGEAISHHPIIVGMNCQGESGYEINWLVRPNKPKLSGTHINVPEYYKSYIRLKPFDEFYEIKIPTVSVHNLIFGKMFIDITEQCIIKNLSKEGERAVINFTGRKAKNPFKVNGEIFDSNNKAHFQIEGKMNDFSEIIELSTGERTRVWKVEPYPDNYEFQYGSSKFQI